MSLNRYAFVASNPANLVDPSGMIYEFPSWADLCPENPGPGGGTPGAPTWPPAGPGGGTPGAPTWPPTSSGGSYSGSGGGGIGYTNVIATTGNQGGDLPQQGGGGTDPNITRCEERCQFPPWILPYWCLQGCFEERPQPKPAVEQALLNATVVYTVGFDRGTDCYPPISTDGCRRGDGNTSLGTIVDSGIMTHDHWDLAETSLGGDSRASWDHLIGKYDWIRVQGARGVRYFRFEFLQPPAYGDGTMLMSIDVTDLGTPAPVSPQLTQGLTQGQALHYAYVPGVNTTQPFVDHSQVQIGRGTYQGAWTPPWGGGESRYISQLYQEGNEQNSPGSGDSGGGYLDSWGRLVGVHRATWPPVTFVLAIVDQP